MRKRLLLARQESGIVARHDTSGSKVGFFFSNNQRVLFEQLWQVIQVIVTDEMRFHRKKGPCERRCFRVCRASPFCRFYQHNMSVASQDFAISVTNWIPKQLPVHS
ncbi:hypothetical protein pipiens_012479 [Culex pipiens pipiens]|uniref:Uncharacterized protein n=1 Tax=Culex pipiens pipiens TaxID=38569 RepID=A0ABD1D3F0_CULPP